MLYILKRVLLAILTVWVVITVTFFVMRAVPGGPFLSEKAVSEAAIAALEAKYGMDKPLFEQYLTYLTDIITKTTPSGIASLQAGTSVRSEGHTLLIDAEAAEVISANGKQMACGTDVNRISTVGWAAGIYIVRTLNGDGQWNTNKVRIGR